MLDRTSALLASLSASNSRPVFEAPTDVPVVPVGVWTTLPGLGCIKYESEDEGESDAPSVRVSIVAPEGGLVRFASPAVEGVAYAPAVPGTEADAHTLIGSVEAVNQALELLEVKLLRPRSMQYPRSTAVLILSMDDRTDGGDGISSQTSLAPFHSSIDVLVPLGCGASTALAAEASYTPALTGLVVRLSEPVDRDFPDGMSTEVDCAELFEEESVLLMVGGGGGGSGASDTRTPASQPLQCRFDSMDSLAVFLGPGSGGKLLPNVSRLLLKADALAPCASDPSGFGGAPASAVVRGPPALLAPEVSLQVLAEPCASSDVTLVAQVRAGAVGFGPVDFAWTLPEGMAALVPSASTEGSASTITIPARFFSPGSEHPFAVRARNWLGVEGPPARVAYARPAEESPLYLLGDELDRTVRSDESVVFLSAQARFSSCAAAALGAGPDSIAGLGSGSNNTVSFEWSVSPALPSASLWESWPRAGAVLAVETSALELTQQYSFAVRAVLGQDQRVSASASLVHHLRVLPPPPRAIIRASSVVSDLQEFLLDGSGSTGASGITGRLFFRWGCARPAGSGSRLCVDSLGAVVAPPPDAGAGAGAGVVASSAVLGPVLLPIGRYLFTLSVWTAESGSASAPHTARATVVVTPSPRLSVSILGGVDTDPGGAVQLEAVVTTSARGVDQSRLRYAWSQVGGPLVGLSSRSTNGPTLTLNPLLLRDFFLAGPEVLLRCVVSHEELDGSTSAGEGAHTVRVNTPPTPGQIQISVSSSSPGSGGAVAMRTEHTLTARGFSDLEGDAPLSYSFFYERTVLLTEADVLANQTDPAGSNDTATIPSSGADRRVYINLPGGDEHLSGVLLPPVGPGEVLAVGVVVRDSRGASSVLTTAVETAQAGAGGLDSGTLLALYKDLVAPAIATKDAARVLYLSALVADSLDDLLSLVEPASPEPEPELAELRSALLDNVVAHARGQPALLAGGALAAVLRTMPLSPAEEADALMLLSLLSASESLARGAVDSGAATQEFRDRVAGIVHRALEAASAVATSASLSVQQEFAPVVDRALAVAFALLAGQSKGLIAQSQLLIQSAQSEQPQQRVSLGLFRSDGVRLSHALVVPLTAGGDLTLNASSDSAMPTVPVDYEVVVTDSNPLLPASLLPDANSSSVVSGGTESATPPVPAKHLLPALVAIHAHYARTDQALPSFAGQVVVVHVPYMPALCTLPPRRASQICAPQCLVWNGTARAWSDDPTAVVTLLSAESVALAEARCQVFLPGSLLAVGQRLATRPGSDGSEDGEEGQGNSPPSSGVFSAQGLAPGGSGFYIVVFLSAAVFSVALFFFVRFVRRYRHSHPADAFPWLGMFPGRGGSASAGVWTGPGAPGLPPSRRGSTSWTPPPLPAGRRRSEFLTPVLVPAFGNDTKSPSPSPPPPAQAQAHDSAFVAGLPASSPSTTLAPGREMLSSPTGTATPSGLAELEHASASPSALLSDGEMLYPLTFVPPRRVGGMTGAPSGSGASTTEHSLFSAAHGSTTHTPLGRVFHYGSSSNASSARGSRASSRASTRPGSKAGSVAGSVVGSRAGSKAGSAANSRAQSRRVSPERGQLLVTVPAGLVHIPRQTPVPDRRTSFIIGEMGNEADDKIEQATLLAAKSVVVAAASPSPGVSGPSASQSAALDPVTVAREAARQAAEQMSRRASSHFANLESIKGAAAVYSKEAAAPRASPPSLAHAPSYGGVAASGIRYAAHVKKQITNVRDLDANGNPVPVPESDLAKSSSNSAD